MKKIYLTILLVIFLFTVGCANQQDITYSGTVDGVKRIFNSSSVYFHDGRRVIVFDLPDVVVGDNYAIVVNSQNLVSFIHLKRGDTLTVEPVTSFNGGYEIQTFPISGNATFSYNGSTLRIEINGLQSK